MKFIIVESPTKAKTIYRLLKIKTIATYGHLKDLPRNSFGIFEDNGSFKAKYIFLPGKKKLIDRIKKLTEQAEEIYLATDPDREGELIAYHLWQNLPKEKTYRITFHEITRRAILTALQNKSKINLSLVSAQQARRFLDRLIGYSLSPILWRNLNQKGLSAGRVQTAALFLIAQREREIRNFQKEKYYLLQLNLQTKLGFRSVYLTEDNQQKKLTSEAKEKLAQILPKIKEVIFQEEKEKTTTLSPNPPLDTELLQRLAQVKLGFLPKKTMLLAQKLFESGLITYHRTDSHYLNPDFSLKVKELIIENYGPEYYQNPKARKGKFAFEAHEAIRPTSLKIPKIKGDFLKLWQLIFFYTLLAHFPPAKVRERKMFFQAKDLLFLGEEKKIIFDGFFRLAPQKIETEAWPKFQTNEKIKVADYQFLEKETEPPKRYTEASLVRKLKVLGIGRPSTYVPILETLKKRKYVRKMKNYLQPTELGEKVIEFFEEKQEKILDLNFTKETEAKLDLIAQGKLNLNSFLTPFWTKYRKSKIKS